MVLSISYDLNRPGQNYVDLIAAIKSLGSYIQPLKSQWFVDTSYSVGEAYRLLSLRIDTTDRLFIDRVTSERIGYLDGVVVEWLRLHRN